MIATSVRPVTFPSGALSLEAAVHLPATTPAPGVVVCHPHPQYGGDMQNNVVVAACEALAQHGFAALRFNFRGVGASEGEFDRGKGERNDAVAALAHLASLPEIDAKRVGLAGYSFGAIVAAEAASGDLCALALVSPPVAIADLRIAWGCPALLLGGDEDSLVPAERLALIADAPGVEMQVFEGADHSWFGFEEELGAVIGEFFTRHFR
jgi:alpha/beta superfamily hydrolase